MKFIVYVDRQDFQKADATAEDCAVELEMILEDKGLSSASVILVEA